MILASLLQIDTNCFVPLTLAWRESQAEIIFLGREKTLWF
jgi:hypothetical protein